MTDTVYDFVTTAVDLVIVSAILSAVVGLLYVSSILTSTQSNEQATSEQLSYYAEYNQFNGNDVYASDVISAIIKFGKEIPIQVNLTADGGDRIIVDNLGVVTRFSSNVIVGNLNRTASDLSSYIKSGEGVTSYYYRATLQTDGAGGNGLGGSISKILFVREVGTP